MPDRPNRDGRDAVDAVTRRAVHVATSAGRVLPVAALGAFLVASGPCHAQPATVGVGPSNVHTAPSLEERHASPRDMALFPGELAPIIADLEAPLHAHVRRVRDRVADPATEVDIAGGYTLDASAFAKEDYADTVLEDMRRFMTFVMETAETPDGYRIRLTKAPPPHVPIGAWESHRIRITAADCEIVAPDVAGLRRAVFRLQDEMLLRRAPILPVRDETRWTRFKSRIIRSPVAPYRWGSGWELEDDHDYYPEAYLSRLAHSGVNGIWVAGLLRNLVASKVVPELGPPEHRLDKLKRLVAKAARHGIGVYLFCIEPRGLPKDHAAVKVHPELAGARISLCTSSSLAIDYVRESMAELFREVPELAGVIDIFCGERSTTCWMNATAVKLCPRCSERPQAEVLGETLDAMLDGIRKSSPTADLLAWSYMIETSTLGTVSADKMLAIMRRTKPEVGWLANFEHGGTKDLFGKTIDIQEYSLSYTGPSAVFHEQAREAKATGRPVFAKLQLGTTFEMSSVPHVPVPGIVYDKMSAAAAAGVSGAMLGWIPGGFPSMMLEAAGEAAFEPRLARQEFLRRLAGVRWGESDADSVAGAWQRFGEAWQRYPFALPVLYESPVTRGPAYQLHLEKEPRKAWPYNFGLDRHRNPQPFTNLPERWRGPFTIAEIVGGFREIATAWTDGLTALRAALSRQPRDSLLEKEVAVATAVRLQCLATANAIEFFSLRDRLLASHPEERRSLLRRMKSVAQDDVAVAAEMKPLLHVEPSIGFHSEIYGRSYSGPLIDAKIRQVEGVIDTLARWERSGIEPAILDGKAPDGSPPAPHKTRLPVEVWGD